MKERQGAVAFGMLVGGLIVGAFGGMSAIQSLDDIYFIPEYIGIAMFVIACAWMAILLHKSIPRTARDSFSPEFKKWLALQNISAIILLGVSIACFSCAGWCFNDNYGAMKRDWLVRGHMLTVDEYATGFNYTMQATTPWTMLITIQGEGQAPCGQPAILNMSATISVNGTVMGRKSTYDTATGSCNQDDSSAWDAARNVGIVLAQAPSSYVTATLKLEIGNCHAGDVIGVEIHLFQGDDAVLSIITEDPAYTRQTADLLLAVFLAIIGLFGFLSFAIAGSRRIYEMRETIKAPVPRSK